MTEGPVSQWDIATYFGLSAMVVAAVGALKKIFTTWLKGKEAHVALVLSYVFGIAAKLFIPGAYANIHWVVFLISLLLVAAGARFGHDHIVNEIIANKKKKD